MTQIPFESLPISQELQRAARELGFDYATEIQSRAIPIIMEGHDLIGRSQTGTGKTAAFAIPAVELTDGENKEDVQVLVVSPTRELAIQSWDVFKKLYKYKSGVKAAVVYGGQPINRQIIELKKGVNIVIGTPGRIMDHLRRRTLKLDHLKLLVLDEADEMLDMGFREDIETILRETPGTRQTLFFCATMPPEIMAITNTYLKQPQLIEINKGQPTIAAIEQFYCEVPAGKKAEALTALLHHGGPRKSIVFCNTQKMVDEVSRTLKRSDLNASGIHGRIPQDVRTQVMRDFKTGRVSILVATDVAARGIDAKDVEMVVNYDIPMNAEDYIHRIGRTGRAGKAGRAFTLVNSQLQRLQIRDYEHVTKSTIALRDLPGIGPLPKMRDRNDAGTYSEHDHAGRRTRITTESEKIPAGEAPALKSGMTKIVINLGKKQHIAPNHIVAAIAENTSLAGREIGKIVMLQSSSVVEIPASHRQEVLDALKGSRIKGLPASGKPRDRQRLQKGADKSTGSRFNHV